jgi:hypothetical protein
MDSGTPGVMTRMPRLPAVPASCPTIATGTITVLGQSVQLWVGTSSSGAPGPLVFYWHGTGSMPSEATGGLGTGNAEIMAQGGVIASFSTSTMMGDSTGNAVWYSGDFAMADQIAACAVAQQRVDPTRIYAAGCSTGAVQVGAMVYTRASYIAAAMTNSGGELMTFTSDDPSHVPALMAAHGAPGSDVVVVDFAELTHKLVTGLAAKGGFAIECDHGAGHCGSPAALKNAQWQFLKDHPFGVSPEPYAAGLPASVPTYCQIVD